MSSNLLLLFLFLLLLLILALSAVSLSQSKNDNNVIEEEQCSSFNVSQCYSSLQKHSSSAYRLHFELVGHAKCASATETQVLLCYEGQLDPGMINNAGMSPELTIAVGNQPTNMVTEMCQLRQQQRGITSTSTSTSPWHGLLVRYLPQENSMELQLSIAGKSYHIPGRNFLIQLGSVASPFAHLLPKMEEEEEKWDRKLREDFFANVGKGARFADFAGLWLLALDMLPSDGSRNEMHAFYSNSTGCNINTTFLSPHEVNPEAQPLATTLPPIVVNKTEFFNGTYQCAFGGQLDVDSSFMISGNFGTNLNEWIEIKLLHNWTEPDAHVGDEVLSIKLRNTYINFNMANPKASLAEQFEPGLVEGKHFMFHVTLTEQGVAFAVHSDSEKLFEGIFDKYRPQMVEGVPRKAIDHIHIKTDIPNEFEVATQAFVLEPTANPLTTVPISFVSELNATALELTDVLFVECEIPMEAASFQINLIRAEPKNPRKPEFVSQLLWKKDSSISLDQNEMVADLPTLKPGTRFSWMFQYLPTFDHFAIVVDGTRIPLPTLTKNNTKAPTHVQFKSDLRVLSMRTMTILPSWYYLNMGEFPEFGGMQLDPMFEPYNDIVLRVVMLRDPVQSSLRRPMRIFFTLDCANADNCGAATESINFVFYLAADYDLNDSDSSWRMLIEAGREETAAANFAGPNGIPFGWPTELRIHASEFFYEFYADDKKIGSAEHYYGKFPTPPKFDSFTVHTTNAIFIDNRRTSNPVDATVFPFWFLEGPSRRRLKFPIPYTYPLMDSEELGVGSKISIKAHLEPNANFSLYLLHNAPQFDERIGAVPLLINVDFQKSVVQVKSYTRFMGWNENGYQPYQFSSSHRTLLVEVEVKGIAYSITVNGEAVDDYQRVLPLWSVDNIFIDGTGISELSKIDVKTMPKSKITNSLEVEDRTPRQISIDISGELPKDAEMFTIKLLDSNCPAIINQEDYYVCDIILQIEFTYEPENDDDAVVFSGYYHKTNTWETYAHTVSIDDSGLVDVHFLPRLGETFFFEFDDGKDFKLVMNCCGGHVVYEISKKNFRIETVKYVQITGDATLHKAETREVSSDGSRSSLQNWPPLTLMKPNPLRLNDAIRIQGTIATIADQGSAHISLYHGLNTQHAYVGQLLMEIKIVVEREMTTFYMNSYAFNGTYNVWWSKDAEKMNLYTAGQIDLKLVAHEKHWKIVWLLDGHFHDGDNGDDDYEQHEGLLVYKYMHRLPYWAVQYVKITDSMTLNPGYPKVISRYDEEKVKEEK